MKKIVLILAMAIFALGADLKSRDFDEYLKSFNTQEIKNMKISSTDMLELIKMDDAILIDIRFKQEAEAWSIPFAKNIPLQELPNRLGELPRDKLIITACPHNDRANMARMYLTMKGYNVKYLNDGLLTTVDKLRGSSAIEFIRELKENK
ncbi:MAG: sulfurtransferase [Sulfurimonas sp. RIFOXYD12_FULL_33_39]|uniref:rhodanese-like domain-containing protein n=1 Tax=unclassified Sulfurimonas TaxID=2623549 RepID=UPI0008BC5A86|nr:MULTISPECIES: rhodanese-like domain-containing protein [unclassified Sulfurimonas]OHE07367.1 MAG: sulfurtransferase [Sulfurimonas sp. RIFCSPLOWO2_12_FULL_34_6]OHE08964.1 MAG: sulfurtransferase [Sulfurimonas sp. RIFOXYD12_FULL_33_39]OHE14274.1 MAG: sulfurtransferase [Sulfurimonas sp. RIFOXYD2_FULL_34_21]DAB28870.1 MAG TPA: sulfurtransferase [Sulfurimonas sp. UBA10385]